MFMMIGGETPYIINLNTKQRYDPNALPLGEKEKSSVAARDKTSLIQSIVRRYTKLP